MAGGSLGKNVAGDFAAGQARFERVHVGQFADALRQTLDDREAGRQRAIEIEGDETDHDWLIAEAAVAAA